MTVTVRVTIPFQNACQMGSALSWPKRLWGLGPPAWVPEEEAGRRQGGEMIFPDRTVAQSRWKSNDGRHSLRLLQARQRQRFSGARTDDPGTENLELEAEERRGTGEE